MCGFMGVVGGNHWRYFEVAQKALPFITRRGPDHVGFSKLGQHGWLYASRLAFQDPRSEANQPFFFDRLRATLAYNGESFNTQRLKTYLPPSVSLRTFSDTEVIGNLLALCGPQVLEEVDGPFAVALYEDEKSALTLARDPLGRKPLFYCSRGDSLLFGSDAQALAKMIGTRRTLSEKTLATYLYLGFCGPDETGFAGVTALPAGSVLKWSVFHGLDLSAPPLTAPTPTFRRSDDLKNDQPSMIRQSILDATLSRAGQEDSALSLSGGIDSTVLLLAAHELNLSIRPYSIHWPDADKVRYSNDGNMALATSQRFGYSLRLIDGPVPAEVPKLLRETNVLLSGPNANPTSLTQVKLQKAIRHDGIRITLTGDGSDEIFLGYPRYVKILNQRHLFSGERLAEFCLKRAPKAENSLRVFTHLGRIVSPIGSGWRNLSWHQLFSPGEVKQLTGQFPEIECWHNQVQLAKCSQSSLDGREAEVAHQAVWDRFTWLAHEANPVSDAISMGLAGEIRCPFQSTGLLRVLADGGVPIDGELGKKSLLRSAFPDLSQTAALDSKQGFVSPVGYWMRGNISEVEASVRSVPRLTGIEEKPILELLHRWKSRPWSGDLRRMWALWALVDWLGAP